MGLDQNLFAVDEDACDQDGNIMDRESMEEIGYWRKHADLHGFVESLWEKAGCPGADERHQDPMFGSLFNCIPFELTEEHIQQIIECSERRSFGDADGTTGFFFGQTFPEDHDKTIEIMKHALELKKEGKRIFYDSWW